MYLMIGEMTVAPGTCTRDSEGLRRQFLAQRNNHNQQSKDTVPAPDISLCTKANDPPNDTFGNKNLYNRTEWLREF